jgi:hypothetical protein
MRATHAKPPQHDPTMADTTTTYERKSHNTTTIRAYVPNTAGEVEPDRSGRTVLETLKRRAAEAYGGFTTYAATGGWQNSDGQLVEENVTVLEVTADANADVEPETWAEVNARWLFDMTAESEVRAEVGESVVTVGIDD